ncbi:MAG: ribosome rescue protein RqcH [Promethearchaeota archaeon]
MIKKEFSNYDVSVITKELSILIKDGKIENVYEVEDILILKITTKLGKKNLIVKKDSRINLTDYEYPIPPYPSQYILSLRKFLKNRRILDVYQYNFDRIIVLELSNQEGNPWKFIIELFNKGNYILIDENNVVKIAKKYKKYREREVLPNRKYSFPKSRGKDFLTIGSEVKDIINSSDAEVVRAIARGINISGLLSEEICMRAGVDKKKTGKDLNENELEKIYKSLKQIRNQLLFGEIKAHIVFDDENEEIAVVPFEMELFKQYKKQFFSTFNEAVDRYFSKLDAELIITPKNSQINEQIKAQEKILKNQIEYLENLIEKKKRYYKYGDFIYANFQNLEKLMNVINEARKKGYSWEDINLKLQEAKGKKIDGLEYFIKIVPQTKELVISINDDEVYLDLTKSIGENANLIYLKGKKAEKKIKGTILAKEKTIKKINKLKIKRDAMEAEVDFLVKKPKKKWYEKFRWFFSSDEFLVIGGRDASSNEAIFKKYLESDDLVLHTNFPGSPLTVIKNPDKLEIPESTIKEAADFVASYSKAWKENWGVVEVFYIKPEQISKSPPSGEYLPKGSFMITGKKHFIKNAKTELALGLEIIESDEKSYNGEKIFYPKFLCGPKTAIEKKYKNPLIILPSKSGLSKGKLAKEIKNYFLKIVDDYLKKWLKLVSIDEIILLLPNGNSIIKQKKK